MNDLDPAPDRSRGSDRVSLSATVQREIWAKAAGRCTLCATYLFNASWTYRTLAVGQIAHVVGASDSAGSPRGQSELSPQERAAAANLMLLCQPCHHKIDHDRDRWPIEYLTELKDQFEARVRAATDFPSLEQTVVIQLTSPIRGNPTEITHTQVSEALRYERLTYAGEDVREATRRITLHEPERTTGVWTVAADRITRQVNRAQEILEESAAQSLSVFALAPIPMLVQLGAAIGTKQITHVFESNRRDDARNFVWPDDSTAIAFETTTTEADTNAEEVVVLASVTAEVQLDRAPAALRQIPRLTIRTTGGPRVALIRSREDLRTFSTAWRDALQTIETQFPRARQLHLLAATPASVSVELGRQRMRDAHPDFVVYQLVEDRVYEPVFTIGA